ncbi:MAG: hypothetical protein RB296_09990 [Acidobacteriota bacterium]|jgi:hypothetical protein|nr:hypothetical protein [Acidobacteriota bacterium]
MKQILFIFLLGTSFLWGGVPDTTAGENDFYGRLPYVELSVPQIVVDGEVANPGPVNLDTLPRHVVTVRLAYQHHAGREFVGAYRVEGVSLFDMLSHSRISKTDKDTFPPPLDLYLEIRDDRGGVVLVSWGEIFFARIPHRILVATRVSPIMPTKIKTACAVPESSLLVCADDLYDVRNLSAPRRITVRSAQVTIPIRRGMAYVSSREIKLNAFGEDAGILRDSSRFPEKISQHTVFFGRGRGFHGFHDFSGWDLSVLLGRYINPEPEFLAAGYLVVTAVDGYRVVFSAAEVFNRNDGNAFMLVDGALCENKGPWSLFPGPDFFSDRAISGIEGIAARKVEKKK